MVLLVWADGASASKATFSNVLEFVSVLQKNLRYRFAGVAGVRFQHDARSELSKNPASAQQDKMFEAFNVNLKEVWFDPQFLNNRIKCPALNAYDSALLASIAPLR